ncbi:LacI family DNA-binding transcriptional regulator [Paractinoplanes ferrugineus]|uniref:LacI family transcriptional regulator n=1 Tax=Paractinoplanes ferrugineus TaxID=113564 RepID=A0A919MDJ0_9ACTN|nr:LacI family DNA-binding transcriptional regulator [Actinoplanes ferrugineus]GIE08565.1 LacI family transcriptional regulator [Actinoplanes ferrugineus]
MPPRLKDVAARAGVSIKTVSNVVNGFVHVAPETRRRVQAAIDALGYVPDPTARRLRGGGSGVIALAVPELRSPYYAELAGLIVQAAEPRGWTVLIEQTDGRGDRITGLRRHSVDGLILAPQGVDREVPDGLPTVLLGERVLDGQTDHVAVDGAAAAGDATRHLLRLGRWRIAAIGAPDRPPAIIRTQRLAGFRNALADSGLAVDPQLVVPVPGMHLADGAAAMAGLLDRVERRPDAVFCFTDSLALGAIRTCLERGLDVPGDIAVIGFDGIEEGAYSTPSLSTIAPDTARIAQLAVDLLAERLGGGPSAAKPPREICVGHRLVARESTLGSTSARSRWPPRSRA